MTVAIQLPVERTEPTQLGRRLFRKQLLPLAQIRYKDGVLDFNRDALQGLVDDFNQGGENEMVPFLLADGARQHGDFTKLISGEVTGLELTDGGVDALIALTDEGAALVEKFPKLAVSASIEPDATDAVTGRKSKLQLKHVLGTIDPVVKGMSPWVRAQLAQENVEVIDLTAADFQGAHMDDYTDEEREVIRARREAAAQTPAQTATAVDDKPLTEDEEREAEEALAKLGLFAPAEPVAATLSSDGAEAINLAHQQLAEQASEIAKLRHDRDAEVWSGYRMKLLTAGVPKSMVDLAAEVFDPDKTKTIDLAEESVTSVRDRYGMVIRKLLEETPRLDLARELGAKMPSDDGQAGDPLERSLRTVAQFKHDYDGADAPGGTA